MQPNFLAGPNAPPSNQATTAAKDTVADLDGVLALGEAVFEGVGAVVVDAAVQLAEGR